MVRERRVFGWIGKVSAGVALLSRANAIVKLLRQIRSVRGEAR